MKLITLTAIAYSHGILPTVTIVRDGVHVRINESDYDPKTMTLAEAPETDGITDPDPVPTEQPAPVAAPVEPVADAPAPTLIVMKQGRKFFIADLMGQKVEGEAAAALGIADTGYATEAEAAAALAGIAPQA